MIEINTQTFEKEVIESDSKVFAVFTSESCPACRRLEPVLTAAVHEHSDVKFCKVYADREPELAKKYSVRSVPMSMVFENGQEKARAVGLLGKREIYEMLSKKPAL